MNAMLKMNEINLEKTKVQTAAVRSILKGFQKHSRGKCIMACGTGKTRVAFKVMQKRTDAITIICVPSLGLVSQFLKDCPEHAPDHRVLPVCCRMENESPEDYDISGATTSPADIAAAMSQASSKRKLLIISTYQSYGRICEAQKSSGEEVGLLIADEAHNTAGPKSKKMSLCLYDCNMHVTNRLFLTATPRLYFGSDEESASMDNEDLYGPEFFQFSFKKALEHGIVCDYEIHIVDVLAFDSLRKIREAEHPAELAETVAAHVASLMKSEDRGRTFVFHTRIDRSQEFSGFLERNGVHSAYITGRDSVKRREMLLREFEDHDGSSVICSVKVFGEGIDAPSVNRIVISDPMTSVIQIAQIIGRGTRVEAGKEKLIIYIPVFVDAGAAGEEDEIYVEKSPFKTAIKVLNAMRSVDESLDAEIQNFICGNSKTGRVLDNGAKWKRILSNVPVEMLRERLIQSRSLNWSEFELLLKASVEKHVAETGVFPSTRFSNDKPVFDLQYRFSTWHAVEKYCRLNSPHGSWSETIDHLFPERNLARVTKEEQQKSKKRRNRIHLRYPAWEQVSDAVEKSIREFYKVHEKFPTQKTKGETFSLPFSSWGSLNCYLGKKTDFGGISGLLAAMFPGQKQHVALRWGDFEPELKRSLTMFFDEYGRFPSRRDRANACVYGIQRSNWGNIRNTCARISPHGSLSQTIKALFPNGKPGD